jgi:hypothetical protein
MSLENQEKIVGGGRMNLKELGFEPQVNYLRQLMKSKGSSLTGDIALSAFRQHLIEKHHPEGLFKPVLRWYLGQLAKMYIRRYFKEAKATLNYLAEIGLVEAAGGSAPTINQDIADKEYHLSEALVPALKYALEEAYGKEYIAKVVSSVKFYRPPESGKDNLNDKNLEVIKDGNFSKDKGKDREGLGQRDVSRKAIQGGRT